MKKIFVFVLLALVSVISYSQGTLKGKIIDSTNAKPMGFATVTVFKASDTALVTYRLSTPEGDFKVPGIPLNVDCRVVISYSGFGVYRKEFRFSASQDVIDLGTISMTPEARSLDEVLLIAERPPVVIRKDTIEFNASSFRTLPNALVEDLLKKLPGVQVDRDGNIAVNGRPVNRILVDGKTFFGDDPKMATRNLPANVIDKIQVTDDKEEMLRNGDDNPNNVGKVVNITLKKGVKKGWFGKLYAGAGNKERYEAGGIANIYRDTLQVSVIGYVNNLNKPGFSFSEMMQAGGFERNRSNSISNSTSIWNNAGGSGLSINGVNFGGSQNFGGVATSRGGGFNLNHAPSSKRSFFAQYFFGNVVIDRVNTADSKQYNADTIINNQGRLTGDVITFGHNIGLGARFKPDSVTNIVFNAQYTIGKQDEDRFSNINSFHNKFGQLSQGVIVQDNLATTRYYRQWFNLTRLSKKKAGRRYSIASNLDINNRFNDYTTESEIQFIYPNPFDSLAAQLRVERIPRTDGNLSFNYSEPLSKMLTLRTGARYEYSRLKNNISTFNRSNGSGEFDIPNSILSSAFERQSHRIIFNPGLEFKWKDFTITPGIRYLYQDVNNELLSQNSGVKQQTNDLLPTLNMVYKRITFGYSRDIVLPFYTHLLPVRDNTNPYFIAKGNPDLQPMRRDNLSLNININDVKRSLNAGGYISAAFTDRDIIQSITVDSKGIQTTVPVNADGTKNVSMNFNVHKQYKNNQKFILSWNTGNWFSFTKQKMLFNDLESRTTTANYNHWAGLGMNWNDKFEWNSSYSIGYNFTRYTNPAFKKLEVLNHSLDNEIVVRFPKHVIWETQCTYSYNSNYNDSKQRNIVRWNAAVNFTMLKDETGVLKLGIYDILNRNNNIWVSASRNMVSTNGTNVLGRYFMATFTYNVRAAGARKKVGGRERLFFF